MYIIVFPFAFLSFFSLFSISSILHSFQKFPVIEEKPTIFSREVTIKSAGKVKKKVQTRGKQQTDSERKEDRLCREGKRNEESRVVLEVISIIKKRKSF